MRQAITEAVTKSAPPVVLVLWNKVSIIPAEKWLTYLTIGYVLLQACLLFRDKVLRDRPDRRRQK